MQFGLSESVAHWGKYRRESPAVIANGMAISYGTLNVDIDRLVPHLLDERADRVAVACSSKYSTLVAILAVLRAGKSVVPLNTGLGDEALATNISDANVEALLHDPSSERIPRLIAQRGGRLISTSSPDRHAPASLAPRKEADEWGVLYSSGTTGTPKGIERDHDSMVTEFLGWILELGLHRKTTFFIGRPIYYTGGLVLAGATLLVGGTIVFTDLTNDNDPEAAWQSLHATLQTTLIEWAFLIPDQLRAFVKTKQDQQLPANPSNVLVMGGPISGDEKVSVSRLLRCEVIESWGNSESLGTITEAEDLRIRPASIGRPFLCDDLCIVDDLLREVPRGVIGRIAGGIEAGFVRYSNRPEATMAVRRDNLIISEDLGYQDEQGYFYILGRIGDSVVRSGNSVFLSQIEARLRSLDSITECCVTAVGDEDSLEIVALVLPKSPMNEAILQEAINAALPEEQHVDRILVTTLPKVPSGKIDRLACKRMAEAHS